MSDMADFRKLAENVNDDTFKELFSIIADRQPLNRKGVRDSKVEIPCTTEDIDALQLIMHSRVQANLSTVGSIQTLDQARESAASYVTDSFMNDFNGIGTQLDPGYYNSASIPVSMSPNEATAYYSSGGVPAKIIDIKSQGILINGYRFLGNNWSPDDLERLHDYADSIMFDKALTDAVRDGLIYGGSLLVPAFKNDNPLTYEMSFDGLIRNKILTKDSISRLWHSDRWNTVLIPDYNIAASDYLTPKTMFVPIAGVTVNTKRAAILRPKQLPYWGTLRQMGWGISEMEGWIRSLLGREMCIAAIPIMAQQSSVLYRHIPLDGIIAQNGPEFAEQFARKMQQQMVQLSTVIPKTFNSVGELKAIERNYQGYPELVSILERDIGSKSGISDTVLFHAKTSGLNDSTEGDTTLKQAESVTAVGNQVKLQVKDFIRVMVYSCFGPDSEQAKKADNVRLDFDSPVILTNEQRNQAGATFSTVFTAMIGGGLQPGDAIELSKAFIPDIELPQDIINKLAEIADMGLNDEVGDGVESLGARLRGENAIPNLGDKLRGESGGEDAPKTGVAGLADRIASPVKKLFNKIKGGSSESA